jgi:hypothetical protein
MTARQIDRDGWTSFFETFTRVLVGKRATIDVVTLDLGNQVAAAEVPLIGISHDPTNDLINIALEGVDQMIRSPLEIYVDHDADGLLGVEFVDREDRRHMVRLTDPLALVQPAAAEAGKPAGSNVGSHSSGHQR